MLLLFQKLLIIFGYGIGQTFIQIISAYLHCKKKSNFNFIRFYLKSLTELSNLENIKITWKNTFSLGNLVWVTVDAH